MSDWLLDQSLAEHVRHAHAQRELDQAFAYFVRRSPDLSRLWDAVALWVALDQLDGWERERLLMRL